MPRKKTDGTAINNNVRPEARREQILYAAAHLFRDQGYASTTLRQIADATGIQAGSIYHYFPSKDDILYEVLEEGMRMVRSGVTERVSRLPPGVPAKDRIAAAIHGHLLGLLVHGDFTSANIRVFAQIPAAIKKRHRRSRGAYAAYWEGLLEDARTEGELRSDLPVSLLRPFVLSALNWTVEWYDPSVHGEVDAFADHLTSLLFDGLLVPPSAARGRSG